MIKLKPILSEKKVAYKFKNIVGGFSDGVSVSITDNPGTVRVSINIYGGGEDTSALRYKVPQKIFNYQTTYIKTASAAQPISNDVASRLVSYKQDIKNTVSAKLYPILQQFDAMCKEAVGKAIAEVNQKYSEQTPAQVPQANVPTKIDNK